MSRPLKIEPFKTEASKHESPATMSAIDIKHPFSIGIFGMTGSGKTVLACQLLCNKQMYRGYFDRIYLFSPTGNADDTFDHLGIPDEQIFTIEKQMIKELGKIIRAQKESVEDKGLMKTKRVCRSKEPRVQKE